MRAIPLPKNRDTGFKLLFVGGTLAMALLLGYRASAQWLVLILAGIGGLVVLQQPIIGLVGIILAALILPIKIPTGTEVVLNPATLLIPVTMGLWLLGMIRQKQIRLLPSPANLPFLAFLGLGLVSLIIGNVLWDSNVPHSGNFWLVQLSQWAIFAFSGGAFWLMGHLVKNEKQLWQLTFLFLLVGGGFAILRVTPGIDVFANTITTVTFIRAPFWILLTGLAAGQLLFNPQLTPRWRIFLIAILAAVVVYSFGLQQEAASNWVGVVAVVAVLFWLRWPQLRWLAILLLIILTAIGFLLPTVYNFAGGDAEWFESGGSRIALLTRVIEVTLSHNPLIGLGPAAYRPYGATQPLIYAHIIWLNPRVSSHNNYVDIFAHTGIAGLLIFAWLSLSLIRSGLQLHYQYTTGFVAGYVNGMLGVGAGSLVIMLLADWILPFVYNIGFDGFQASLLVWLFLGGFVVIANQKLPAFSGAVVTARE